VSQTCRRVAWVQAWLSSCSSRAVVLSSRLFRSDVPREAELPADRRVAALSGGLRHPAGRSRVDRDGHASQRRAESAAVHAVVSCSGPGRSSPFALFGSRLTGHGECDEATLESSWRMVSGCSLSHRWVLGRFSAAPTRSCARSMWWRGYRRRLPASFLAAYGLAAAHFGRTGIGRPVPRSARRSRLRPCGVYGRRHGRTDRPCRRASLPPPAPETRASFEAFFGLFPVDVLNLSAAVAMTAA